MSNTYFINESDVQESDYYIQKNSLNTLKKYKEIGHMAVWSLSSAKEGNGIHQLRDENAETFWQSDGPTPHNVNIQFQKKIKVSHVAIYLDSKTDESYTPEIIVISGGINIQNLSEIRLLRLSEPNGWIIVPLNWTGSDNVSHPYLYTMNLQISIRQMFHSGKDTHVRQVKVFGYDGNTLSSGNNNEVRSHMKFNEVGLR